MDVVLGIGFWRGSGHDNCLLFFLYVAERWCLPPGIWAPTAFASIFDRGALDSPRAGAKLGCWGRGHVAALAHSFSEQSQAAKVP